MKADEILDRGAEKIAAGWCRNSFSQRGVFDGVSDRFCAMGAMREVALGKAHYIPAKVAFGDVCDEYWKAEAALADVMREQFPTIPVKQTWAGSGATIDDYYLSPEDIIANANDLQAQTKEEIVACMEKAAVNLRSAP